MGKSTPFAGNEVFGECIMTVRDKKAAYINGGIING